MTNLNNHSIYTHEDAGICPCCSTVYTLTIKSVDVCPACDAMGRVPDYFDAYEDIPIDTEGKPVLAYRAYEGIDNTPVTVYTELDDDDLPF